ncbi:putative short-chain dehydrogenase [Rhizodiscina lignyota]|uniref:Short-chain dehydrogenase n=1 Tax=Rhizodiscina lignyota TaxID=1504668 RepID=A0A9P4M0P3_9PEZI|nr:putative short-chain dehydrogenase [Rhizodiscina lignyota]
MPLKYTNKLQDKRVLIFGATSGIGYAVAEASIEHGAKLIISGSKQERLLRTIERLKASYPDIKDDQIVPLPLDLSPVSELEQKLPEFLSAASENGTKKIDHIVFTAGDMVNLSAGIAAASYSYINSIMAIRLIAPTLIAKEIAAADYKYVNKSAQTSITLTSGTAHLRSRNGWSVVAMVSAALEGICHGLAVDLAPVRVNVVNPGVVNTELLGGAPAEIIEKFKETTLTKKLGQPEDIAEAYLYSMKDSSADGSTILSDNGKVLAS